jgi:Asp-tRNA(Asn)/Glu-tRNA(Gln) amidotransferase A subunit family amidase
MTGVIQNISARHLNEIGNALPDDRQFLRSWRRQLQECLNQQNARVVRFLLADISNATMTEADITKRCQDVIHKYSKATISIRDLSLPVDSAKVVAEIEREIGISPFALRDAVRKAVRLYVSAATNLCAAENHLEEKLKRLEAIVGRVNDLMFLEPTAELEQMEGPTRTYLDSVLNKIALEDEYRELTEQFKKFTILKSIVSLASFQRSAAPTCSICMSREIAQVVTPCGHTFCEECCRTQMTACYICRVQIRDKVRLYFS